MIYLQKKNHLFFREVSITNLGWFRFCSDRNRLIWHGRLLIEAEKGKVCKIFSFDKCHFISYHIVRLDIPMNDSVLMQIFKCHCYFGAVELGGRFAQTSVRGNQRFQITTNHVFHNLKPIVCKQKLENWHFHRILLTKNTYNGVCSE